MSDTFKYQWRSRLGIDAKVDITAFTNMIEGAKADRIIIDEAKYIDYIDVPLPYTDEIKLRFEIDIKELNDMFEKLHIISNVKNISIDDVLESCQIVANDFAISVSHAIDIAYEKCLKES